MTVACASTCQIIELSPIGLERPQKPRADRREVVAIVDCWDWGMMCENLFSGNIVPQAQ